MPDLDLSKGIDLSALTAKRNLPEGATECTIDGGCNFVVVGEPHTSKDDCLKTALPYVEMYMQVEEASIQVIEEYKKVEAYAIQLKRQNSSLIAANQNLLADVEKYAADLRRLRKDNPEEQKSALLEAAGNLVKAVQPVEKSDPVADAARNSAAAFLGSGK
jgi:hypothetical protein